MAGPRISVVIPTRGRPAALAACLDALSRSSLNGDELEVVVVSDGEGVTHPATDDSLRVVWCSQAHQGPAAARNHGARVARADVLAFTDDDCVPAPDWAQRMLTLVEAQPHAVVGGQVRNGLPDNPWSTASHLVLEVVIDLYNGRTGSPGFAPTNNLAMSRDLFFDLAGFDERFRTAAAEDREFCDRCFAAGHPLVISEKAVVEHRHELNARDFLRQSAAYGRGEVTYRVACNEQGRPANVVKNHFYRGLLLAALAEGPRRGGLLVLLAGASQIVFMGSYWTARCLHAG